MYKRELRLSYRVVQKNRAFFERLARTYQKHGMGRSRYKKMIRMEHEALTLQRGHDVRNAYLYLLH